MTFQEKLDFLMIELATLRTDISYIKNSIISFSTHETRISILNKNVSLLQKIVYSTIGLILTAVTIKFISIVT